MVQIEDVLAEIENRRNRGAGLAHFQEYLASIDHPERSLSCIHIAGTNGKGSTLNYIRSILQEAGYRVGTFSSPYLETHFDRIRINDHNISEADFLSYYETYHDGWYAYDLSAFEIDTALCFQYFKDQQVDICIIEAGIGGRFDCTNVIEPCISIITNIGKDHVDRLGSTFQEIAWQKAGIIKKGVPLITAETKPACLEVFQSICETMQAPLISIANATNIHREEKSLHFQYQELSITLSQIAKYQIANCACAIEAVKQLQQRKQINIETDQIITGLKQALWKGRFETVCEDPLIILDGAHNEEGIQALCETIKEMGKVKILFAALKDKDTHRMMELLTKGSDDVCVSEFSFYRAKSAQALAEDFPVRIVCDYREVIQEVMKQPELPLIITGSLYFISEVRSYLCERKQF